MASLPIFASIIMAVAGWSVAGHAQSGTQGSCSAELTDKVQASALLQVHRDAGNPVLLSEETDLEKHEEAYAAETWANLKYETMEHKQSGDNVTLTNGYSGANKMVLPSGFEVTYGEILSMCGDYYANGDHIICRESDPIKREDTFVKYLWGCIANDTNDPMRFFTSHETSDLQELQDSVPAHCSGFAKVTTYNYDHFVATQKYSFEEQNGLGAQEAYGAGHSVACKAAAAGANDTEKLQTALMMNACSSHFLSDMFTAGHLRTPRNALPGAWTGAASYEMHNEDNQFGLNVENRRGDKWIAYGDKCRDSPKNAKNREIEIEALTASAEAVLQAWQSGSADICQADENTKNLMIDFLKVQDPTQAKAQGNSAPMFVAINKEGDVWGDGEMYWKADSRNYACSMDDYNVTSVWTASSTGARLALCGKDTRGSSAFPGRFCLVDGYEWDDSVIPLAGVTPSGGSTP